MNAEVPSQLTHRTRLSHQAIVMWGSVVGGLIGAVVGALAGGAVTYYRERMLEKERRHEEVVEKLYHKVAELSIIVSRLTVGNYPLGQDRPYPEDARDLAQEVEELATDLTDDELKREVIRTMNREYDSPEEICWQLEQVELELRKRAYPALFEIKPDDREPAPERATRIDGQNGVWAGGWRGPAKFQFLLRMKERGWELRVENED